VRGLLAQPSDRGTWPPPFASLRGGMGELVAALVRDLRRTELRTSSGVSTVRPSPDGGYLLETTSGEMIAADAVVLAIPAFAVAELVVGFDDELATAHGEIPYASSAVVTLAFRSDDVTHPLDGYGYVVPRSEGSDVLACTWTSRKWAERAPDDAILIRVYLGRFGGRDVTEERDRDLLALGRLELELLGIDAGPQLTRIHRWPRGMPQYVLGHPERLRRIELALAEHPGLAVAGAAYRGVGIPDCIRSGEDAAETVARSLAASLG